MENNIENAEKFCKSKKVQRKKFKGEWYPLSLEELVDYADAVNQPKEYNTTLVLHPIGADNKPNKKVAYCYTCGVYVKTQKYCSNCGKRLLWDRIKIQDMPTIITYKTVQVDWANQFQPKEMTEEEIREYVKNKYPYYPNSTILPITQRNVIESEVIKLSDFQKHLLSLPKEEKKPILNT